MKTRIITLLTSICLLVGAGNLFAQVPAGASYRFETKNFNYQKFKKTDFRLEDSLHSALSRRFTLDTLLAKGKQMVSAENYDALVSSKFRLLSGNEIKGGKSHSAAAVVDEKSITLNFAFKLFRDQEKYLLPVISVETEKSFVDIFSNGSQSRTISWGLNYTFLSGRNFSNFLPTQKRKLHNRLILDRGKFTAVIGTAEQDFFIQQVQTVRDVIEDPIKGSLIDSLQKGRVLDSNYVILNGYEQAVDTLVKVGILPRYFPMLNLIDQVAIVNRLNIPMRVSNVVLNRFLNKTDATQQSASFTSHNLYWWVMGTKLNHIGHDILAPLEVGLTRKSVDTYLSAIVAFTWMRISEKGPRFYFSPSANFSNASYYPKTNLVRAQVYGNAVPIGSLSGQTVKHDITYYKDKANARKYNTYLDLPFALYNSKLSFGVEAAVKLGVNDIENDNASFRIGPLFVLNPGAETQFVLQPVFKFNKLNQKIKDLWVDHFVFGANLSVSIPNGFFKKMDK